MTKRGRYACDLPPVVCPPGATNSRIIESEKRFLDDILSYKGDWPTRPTVKTVIHDLLDLQVGDEKTGKWKVVQDVMTIPPTCPSCHQPPKWGCYVLKEEGGYEIKVCGMCLRDLAPPDQKGLIRRYWTKAGRTLHAISDWRDLMVVTLIWLELHRDYENQPGTAREMWLAVRWFYRRYMRYGYLRDYHANVLYVIVTEGRWTDVSREQSEIDTFRQGPKWTPEQNYLSTLLSPELFPYLTVMDKDRVFQLFKGTGGDEERLGEPRTRTYLAGAHARALRRKNWRTGYG